MMVCHRILLFIVLSPFYFELVDMTSGIRKKRVMYGLPTAAVDRDEYYPHFRYYVFLAKEDYVGQIDADPSWWKRWLSIDLTPLPTMMHCGGSLLTPSIVQTACHCLASYTKQVGNFTYATPKNSWENRYYSYVGSNIIDELTHALTPKNYIIHEACRTITKLSQNMYDFGVIVNKESIHDKAKDATVSYVPIYRGLDIRNFFYTAVHKEYTCVFIGYGKWTTLPAVDGQVQVADWTSNVLRWGWRSLRSYKDCKSLTCPPFQERQGLCNYRVHATWSCFSSTTRFGFQHAGLSGDSGGAVICNNVYFAVQSFGQYFDNRKAFDNMATPIAYTAFENAVESRDDFIKFCNEYGANDVNPTRPPNPLKPTPPRLFSLSAHFSRCPPKIILPLSMLLSSILFTWLSYC